MMKKRPRKMAPLAERFAALDFETDPFLYARVPKPFCAGIAYIQNGNEIYREFWGADCAAQLAHFILNELPGDRIIYAHNGGKFDFLFLRPWLENTDTTGVRMIGARLVECAMGRHKLRDSFAIMPVGLKASGEKLEIDYGKLEEEARDSHRDEICRYLKADCFALLRMVYAFANKFVGDAQRPKIPLTIGATAEKALRATLEHYQCPRITAEQDAVLRRFYYGGRVQCFETGAIHTRLKSFDVNSMYPGAMRNYSHPDGKIFALDGASLAPVVPHIKKNGTLGPKWSRAERVYFVRFTGWARHLPLATENGIVYEGAGEYYACSHEVQMAFEKGCIRIDEVLEVHVSQGAVRFSEFVDKYYGDRMAAKAAGDEVDVLFLKLVLNSAYGRFAINPTRFRDTAFTREKVPPDGEGWKLNNRVSDEDGDTYVWRRELEEDRVEKGYKNVAIAASITSAARAELARGIMSAKRVVYCDTDSITCEDFAGNIDAKTVGAWKFEGTYLEFHIAGKKTYAGRVEGAPDGKEWKTACKGARLTPAEIVRVAAGETVTYKRDAPTFSWLREPKFVVREITATA